MNTQKKETQNIEYAHTHSLPIPVNFDSASLYADKLNTNNEERQRREQDGESNNCGRGYSTEEIEAHPYAFHVSGPWNISSPNLRDLINSIWLAY